MTCGVNKFLSAFSWASPRHASSDLALQRPASLPTALPRQPPKKVVQIAFIKPNDAAVHLIFRNLLFCYLVFCYVAQIKSK